MERLLVSPSLTPIGLSRPAPLVPHSSPQRWPARLALLLVAALLLALAPLVPAHAEVPGGTIAFVSDRTGADELYVMDADGARVTRLTDNPGFDRAPAWSPDGTTLVFNSRRDPHADRPQLYTVQVADPTSVQRLSDSATEDLRGSWFPTGDAVVFQRGGLFDGPDLFRLDVTDGTVTPLTSTPGTIDAAGAVSPDGSTLAFQSNRDLDEGFFPFRLFLLDLDSDEVTPIADVPGDGSDDGSDDGPRWSPDGSQLVFARSGSLRLVDVDTGVTTVLTDGDEFDVSPSFSPDGTEVLFQSDRVDEDGGIHAYDLATGSIRYLGEGRTPVWTATFRTTFADVPGTHPFATEITWLLTEGLTRGFDGNEFRPNLPVTRQAAAAFLYRRAGEPEVAGVSGFTDVPASHPFHDAIVWLEQEGITEGFADDTFRPTVPVSRQAAAAFLHRAAGSPEVDGAAGFTDVPASHPFHDEVAWLVEEGIAEGFDDGTFRPARAVTRQAMAAFLYRSQPDPAS